MSQEELNNIKTYIRTMFKRKKKTNPEIQELNKVICNLVGGVNELYEITRELKKEIKRLNETKTPRNHDMLGM